MPALEAPIHQVYIWVYPFAIQGNMLQMDMSTLLAQYKFNYFVVSIFFV